MAAHFTDGLTEALKVSVTGLGLQQVFSEPMKERGKQTRERKGKEEGRKRAAGGRGRGRGKGKEVHTA